MLKPWHEQPSVSGLTSSMRKVNVSGESSKGAIGLTPPATRSLTKVTFSDVVSVKSINNEEVKSEEKVKVSDTVNVKKAIKRRHEQITTSQQSFQNQSEMMSPNREENVSIVPRGRYKLKFSEVFTVYDPKEKYVTFMKNLNFDHAYEVLRKQHISGSVGLKANHLKNFHEILLINRKPEPAANIRQTLIKLIKEKMEVVPDEIIKFAEKLVESRKFLDAMLFYFIAADFFRSTLTSFERLKHLDLCLFKMAQCMGMLLKTETKSLEIMRKSLSATLMAIRNLKHCIRCYLIPMAVEIKGMIQSTEGATEQQLCLFEAWCAHRIEFCHGLVDNNVHQERIILEAINALKKCFGSNAQDYYILGILFDNLGHTYFCTRQFIPATKYYQLAVNAYIKAKDYSNPETQATDIEMAAKYMKEAQNRSLY
ncbi:uncharacterized protein LOC143469840 [Clavelina lepadiformis]|uniref:uncharacterized protein LOC143469840 n=1 Tax=Clavelina lepadiformis TaxID=159417 RepID=UPI004042F460